MDLGPGCGRGKEVDEGHQRRWQDRRLGIRVRSSEPALPATVPGRIPRWAAGKPGWFEGGRLPQFQRVDQGGTVVFGSLQQVESKSKKCLASRVSCFVRQREGGDVCWRRVECSA